MSRLHRVLSVAIVVSMLLSIAGCGGGGPEITPVPTMARPEATTPPATVAPPPTAGPTLEPPPAQPPRLSGTSPARGEEQRLDEPVVIEFDQPMDRAAVESAFRIEPEVPGRLEWRGPATVAFIPEAPLARGAEYQVLIDEDAASAQGLSPVEPLAFRFQTVGTLEITDVAPVPDSIDVATDTVIRVVFNRPVVPLVAVREQDDLPDPLVFDPPVEGEGEWTNTSIYTFQPTEPLVPGARYTVTVPAGLEDTTGGVLEEDFVWSFTTELPRVVEVLPGDGARYVPQDAAVRVVFSQAMDTSATEDYVRLYDGAGEPVSGFFTWDGNTLILEPLEALTKGETYRVEITAGAPAASGEATLPEGLETRFTVVDQPRVLAFSPQGQAVDPGIGIEITFSAPIDVDTFAENITITPKAEFQDYWRDDDTVVYVSTYLEPSTEYTVRLSTGILGKNGDPLAEEVTYAFTTRPFSPSFYLDAPYQVASYNAYALAAALIRAMNIEQLNLFLYTLSPEDFFALNGQNAWQRWQSYQPPMSQQINRWSLEPEGELNVEQRILHDLTYEDGSDLEPGLYYLRISSPQVPRNVQNHLMVVTARNVTIKSVVGETLVWVTDLESGQPVEGEALRILGDTGDLFAEVTTDAEGLAEATHAAQEPWETLFVLVQEGDALTAHLKGWSQGIRPWDFGVSFDPYPQDYRAMLYTDREIYRPGQMVYFKGILRTDADGDYGLPGGEPPTVAVRVIDVEGRELYAEDLPISDMGTIDGEFLLDAEAALGFYRVEAEYDEHFFGDEFTVAEYRRPEFEVTVATDAPEYVQGDTIAVRAQAAYYFGGPVANAEVRWSVVQSPYYFGRWEGQIPYSFTDFDYESRWFTSGSGLVTEGTGRTDAQGAFSFEVPADLGDEIQSQMYTVEVAVTDRNNQEVAARASAIVHKGEFYIGVAPLSYVGTAGQPQDVSVITVDTEGITVTAQSLTATLLRREWLSVREEADDGRFYWTNSIRETAVATETVTTDDTGHALVTFAPEEGGSYRVLVTGRDGRENEVRSSAYLWVSAREYVNWGQENTDAIELIADRDLYRPGETATVLIPSPYEGEVQALLTIERGRVLERRLITLASNSEQVEIPITADYAPNVFVSVTIVQGMGEESATPSMKVGYVELPVSTEQQELTITITPDGDEFRPREEVTFHILAQDHEGQGVEAEMSVKLVDRAVEALTGGDPTNIVEEFYRQRPLAVETGSTLTVLVDRLLLLAESEGKGGGGGMEGDSPSVRQDFRDTAFWDPTVRTDGNGEATVSVTLPDNLTTWRMAVQAVTAGTEVGMGDVQIVSTLDVLIRPVAPRFMVIGDEPLLGAIVHNNTEEDLDLTVVLEAAGVTVEGPEQQVTVAAGGQEALTWPAAVADVGAATLRYSVSGGGFSDAIEMTLPVYHATSPEVVGTAGQVDDRVLELIRLPLSAETSQGDLTVHLEPSLAAGMVEGLEFLRHFPYECVEQTVSRFLPNVVTYRALGDLGVDRPDLEETLPDLVGTALQRLYRGQNLDGGWGWWPTQQSSPLMTSYVVFGMSQARDAGFAVDADSLRRGIDYLYSWLNRASSSASPDLRATVLYSLAEAGQGDLGRTIDLYDDARHDMSLYALGYLAMALEILEPEETARVDDLANEFANAAILSASGAHWEEEEIDRGSMNTNLRTTAIVLRAMQRIAPDSGILPNAVRWLMTVRENARWSTTQENVWAILALTDYMAATGELAGDYQYTLTVNSEQVTEGSVTPETVDEPETVTVPIADLEAMGDNQVLMERSDGPGRLYYSAFLRYFLPAEGMRELNRGIFVTREYTLVGGDPDEAIDAAEATDQIRVKLTIIAPNDLHYVVVEDPLPAGCEAIDPRLAITSQVAEGPEFERQAEDGRMDPWAFWWGWPSRTEMRDEKVVLFADYLARGTYEYTYTMRATTPGAFQVLPATAYEFYFPDVFGRSAGSLFRVME